MGKVRTSSIPMYIINIHTLKADYVNRAATQDRFMSER